MRKRVVLILVCCILVLTSCGTRGIDEPESSTTATLRANQGGCTWPRLIKGSKTYNEYKEYIVSSEFDAGFLPILSAVDPIVKLAFQQNTPRFEYYEHDVADDMRYCWIVGSQGEGWYSAAFGLDYGVYVYPKREDYYDTCVDLMEDFEITREFPESYINEDLRSVTMDGTWTPDPFETVSPCGYYKIGNAYYCWTDWESLGMIAFETDDYVVAIFLPTFFTVDDQGFENLPYPPELEPYYNLSTAPEAINKIIAAANGETVQ